MRSLTNMKNILKFPLNETTLCMIGQKVPYSDNQLLANALLIYGFNGDVAGLNIALNEIDAKAVIYTSDPAGKVVINGVIIEEFVHVESTSTNRFSYNGATNLKEAFKEAFVNLLRNEMLLDIANLPSVNKVKAHSSASEHNMSINDEGANNG